MIAGIGLFALIVGALILRVNIAAILLMIAALVHMVWGDGQLTYILEDMWNSIDKEVLLAIPLFILSGALMGKGGIARRLIEVVRSITAPIPGGLALATIVTCAIFSAISGSSIVTLIAIGTIAYPALLEEGYSRPFSLGALAAGGTLGVLIPPSIPMILYGIVTETSIIDLFTAGILPGLVFVVLLGGYSVWVNRRIPRGPFSFSRLVAALRDGIWALLMPVILLGGIYSGVFSPTEAAAVALAYSLIVEILVHREIGWRELLDNSIDTTILLGSLFPLLAVATSLNILLTIQRVPTELVSAVSGIIESQTAFLLVSNVLLLIVGCIMDMTSAVVVLAPILNQMAEAYGIDPTHFGVIMTVNLEIGLLTPPVGLNLIVAMTVFREPFSVIVKGVLPFIAIMLFGLVIVTLVPQLSLLLVR